MKTKKRNPIISLLLSIIAPGLGQIYNGQLKKGIFLYFVGLLILLTYSIVGLYFYGLIIYLLIGIGWFLFIIIDSLVTSIRIKHVELNNYNRWYFYVIFFLIINVISLGSTEFLVKARVRDYSIPSGAMQPTLLIGDYITINNSAYGIRNPFTNQVWIPTGTPQRGDVAVFIFPQDPTKEYIKRVIGLPGDRIQINNKQVMINNRVFKTLEAVHDDPAVIPPSRGPGDSPRDNMAPVVVPANSYFVLGDNRDYSYDSRFWGFVPLENLRGKALYIYLSWDSKNQMLRWNRIGKTIN